MPIITPARAFRLPLSALVTGLALPLALVLVVLSLTRGTLRAVLDWRPWDVDVPLGVHVDVTSAVLVLLVAVVGVTVRACSRRVLDGALGLARFDALLATAVLALLVAVTAAATVAVPVALAAAGAAVAGLVGHHGGAASRRAARAFAVRLLAADALALLGLVAAAGLTGTADRARLTAAVASLDGAGRASLQVALIVVVLGVAVRSALAPTHRWLAETAWAPTPVSALLHAGVVNGGPALLVLAWPLLAAATPARMLLAALGLLSILGGGVLLRARADVKGRLACSTTTQLGYTAVQLGLGLPAAALGHLVGHGWYKSALFLGQGELVARLAAQPEEDVARPVRRGPLAVGAVGLLAAAATLVAVGPPASIAELVSVAVALAAAVGAWSAVSRGDGRAPGSGVRPAQALVLLVAVAAAPVALAALHLGASLTGLAALPTGAAEVAVLVVFALVLPAGALGARALARRSLGWRAALARADRPVGGHDLGVGRRRLSTPEVRWTEPSATEVQQVAAAATQAAGVVAPAWPLGRAAAVDPLSGLSEYPYDQALRLASASWQAAGREPEVRQWRRHVTGEIDGGALHEACRDWAAAQPGLWTTPAPRAAVAELVRSVLVEEARSAGRDAGQGAGPDPAPDGSTGAWRRLTFAEQVDHLHGSRVADVIDELVASWCSALLLGGLTSGAAAPAGDPAPSRLFEAWHELAAHPAAHLGLRVRGLASAIANLPRDPDQALACLLTHLDVPPALHRAYLSRLLARTPGWVGHVRWRQGRPEGQALPATGVSDLLALRMALEVVLGRAVLVARGDGADLSWRDLSAAVLADVLQGAAPSDVPQGAAPSGVAGAASASSDGVEAVVARLLTRAEREVIWQDALERSYRGRLLGALTVADRTEGGPRRGGRESAPVRAGLITCIDVRSERLRRHLEDAGGWATWGTAGFFGFAVRHLDAQGRSSDRCPVLLTPAQLVRERTPDTAAAVASRALTGAQNGLAGALAVAELLGWAYGAVALARSVTPRLGGRRPQGRVVVDDAPAPLEHDLSVRQAADLAEAALRTIGLVDDVPEILIVCGHRGATSNNPFAAAYDCGACGGVAGGVNARLLAESLRRPLVRAVLATRGLVLPSSVTVLAAEHDTTTDRVHVFGPVPVAARGRLHDVLAGLEAALAATAAERSPALPPAPRGGLPARARDWAQPRPEWGLAGAAALVVADRALTRGVDLGGRSFLQSYRHQDDPDGTVLAGILAGPGVVAAWITGQYSFSTRDPHRFGAGDKALHNVVGVGACGLLGVVTGPRGDLRIGLPWQALFRSDPASGADPEHRAQRLLCVVQAPLATVEAAVRRGAGVGRLVEGGWVRLVALSGPDADAHEWLPGRGWGRLGVVEPVRAGFAPSTIVSGADVTAAP